MEGTEMRKITKEGVIERDGSAFVARVLGKPTIANGLPEGVECENPTAPEAQQIYRKRFVKNRIFLPREYERAYLEILTGPDVVVLAATGYSSLTAAQCRQYGVEVGAYEKACEAALLSVYGSLAKFRGIDIRFAHGASAALGVDSAIIKAAKKVNKYHLSLGHSCPRFLMYVPDDGMPVYVGRTQAEYSDKFTSSAHIMLACNGRLQAFEMDLTAAIRKRRKVVPLNILRMISSNGGPPAYNADGKIEDAVAVYEDTVHTLSSSVYMANDPFKDGMERLQDKVTALVRPMLSPDRAFADFLSS
jgi:hypothetical protein